MENSYVIAVLDFSEHTHKNKKYNKIENKIIQVFYLSSFALI